MTAAAKDLFAVVCEPGAGVGFGRDGWLEVLSDVQAAKNVLAAVEAVALAHAAAFDSEDGSGSARSPTAASGHRALDAPDLVADRLGCSSLAAAGRVEAAVEQVTTMPALVEAMACGGLDGYRAGVVTDELSDAPAEVRAAVVDALAGGGHLTGETAGPLRRRTRKVLGALAPEVLAARVARAQERRGLHRCTEPDGLDHWQAWLPAQGARPAWAAVTELAQSYLREGRADTLAQARADALLDLLLGRACGSYAFHVTVPVSALAQTADAAQPGSPESAAGSADQSRHEHGAARVTGAPPPARPTRAARTRRSRQRYGLLRRRRRARPGHRPRRPRRDPGLPRLAHRSPRHTRCPPRHDRARQGNEPRAGRARVADPGPAGRDPRRGRRHRRDRRRRGRRRW